MYCKLLKEECIACGLCQVICPDVFDYDNDGIVRFIDEPSDHQFIPNDQTDLVMKAAKRCPVRAIIPTNSHELV